MPSCFACRLAHPGGPVVTNKAAALARFLKRKLQDPEGFAALDPELVEKAVKAAKTGKTTQGEKLVSCLFVSSSALRSV